jgi:putative addiction module killer protein
VFFEAGDIIDKLSPIEYNPIMKYELDSTEDFDKWFERIKKDGATKKRLLVRLAMVENGHFGDHKLFGNLGELRFRHGAGIRVYYTIRNNRVVLLLAGGDKASQQKDFEHAKALLDALED